MGPFTKLRAERADTQERIRTAAGAIIEAATWQTVALVVVAAGVVVALALATAAYVRSGAD